MPVGSWRSVLEIAAWTSWAAASMLRSRVNCSVMLVLRRHRRRHRLRTRSGETGVHGDGGKVHVREVAHRKQPVGHQPEHQDAYHDERRHDGSLDEELGNAHLSASSSRAGSATPLTSTGAPETRRTWPSVTTSSPGRTPCAITA